MTIKKIDNPLFDTVRQVVLEARQRAYRSTNSILLKMYWDIGALITEQEQHGKSRAEYGKKGMIELAKHLTIEFGKGFDERNLSNMRAFYQSFPIWYAVRTELSWTHYRILCRISTEQERERYIDEAISGNWNTRTLQRNIDSNYLARLLEIPDQSVSPATPRQFIKDPYIFEFLGIEQNSKFNEAELETALINHLHNFLLELGKGFAFVARQQHISTNTSDFYIDLVFYNYYLKCFVLLDLKTTPLTHENIGQMDMYVRMYDDLKKGEDDNPTIGMILCTDKDETIVKYSVLAEHEKLFASKYRIYLPDEQELKQLIEQDRTLFDLNTKVTNESP